jgi:hypothetical protein
VLDRTDDSRAHNRERQRRWQRLKAYPVPAGHDELNFPIDLGWLGEDESADAEEVGKAIAAMVKDAAKSR